MPLLDRLANRKTRSEIDVWSEAFGVGERLPTLPLYVAVDLAMLVDFEATYQETCRRLRVPTIS